MSVSVLCLVWASLLLLGGVCPQHLHHFSSAGQNVTLPCHRYSPERHDPTCKDVSWLYSKGRFQVVNVSKGKLLDRFNRLILNPDCSVSLRNITVEDAGVYTCEHDDQVHFGNLDSRNGVDLRVLTVALAQADSNTNGFVTLQCSLGTSDRRVCGTGSFRWIEEHQKVLSGDTEKECVSYLTVEPESVTKTFSCQFAEGSIVRVFAELTVEAKGEAILETGTQECSIGLWFLILKSVGWAALICTTVVVSIYTRDRKQPKKSRRHFEMTFPDFYPDDSAPAADYENQQ